MRLARHQAVYLDYTLLSRLFDLLLLDASMTGRHVMATLWDQAIFSCELSNAGCSPEIRIIQSQEGPSNSTDRKGRTIPTS